MGDVSENVRITVEGADGLARAAVEARALADELKKVRDAQAEAAASGAAMKHELGGAGTSRSVSGLRDIERAAKDAEAALGGGGGGGGGGLLSSIAGLAPDMGAFAAGAAVVGPAILAAAVEASALVTGFAAAGAGLGAFGLLAAPTFEKVKNGYTAVTTAQKKYAAAQKAYAQDPTKANLKAEEKDLLGLKAAWSAMDPAQRTALHGIMQLKSTYTSMAKAFEPDAMKVFNGGLKAANELLPDIKPFADTAAHSLSGLLGHLDKFLKTSKEVYVPGAHGKGRMVKEQTPFGSWLQQFHGYEKPSMDAIGKGFGQVSTAFGKMLTTLKPQTVVRGIGIAFGAVSGTIKGFSYAVKTIHKNWNDMTAALGHSYGNVHHAADNVGHVFTNLHHAVDNVGHAFSNMHHAADNIGHAFTNIHHAADNVGHAFTNVHHAIDNVGHAFTNIHHTADNIGHAFSNIGKALTPGAIGSKLKSLGKDIAGAFDGVAGAIKGKIQGIVAAVSGIGAKIASAVGNFGGSLVSKGAALIQGLISGIQGKVGAAVAAVSSLPGKFVGAIGNLGGLLVSAGASLIGGLISGIKSMAGAAVGAIESVGHSVVSAALGVFHINSPSLVFKEIGSGVIEGFILGLQGGKSQVQTAVNTVFGVKPFNDSTISKTIASLKTEMAKAVKAGKLTPAQQFGFTQILDADNPKLQKLAKQRQSLINQIKAADALALSVKQAAIAGGDITQIAQNTQAGQQQANLAEGAPGTAQNPYQNIQQGLQAQLGAIRQFRSQIKQLKKDGLDKAGIQQLLAAGVQQGGATATQMLAGGKAGVQQIAKLQDSIGLASKKLGITGANAAYESGSQIGEGLAAGLKASLKSVDSAMASIARTLVTTLMTAMGASGKDIRAALKKLDKELGVDSGGGGGGKAKPPQNTPPHIIYNPPPPPGIMRPAGMSGAPAAMQPITVIVQVDGKEIARTTQKSMLQHAKRNVATGLQLAGRGT